MCIRDSYEDYIDPVPAGPGGEGRRMTMRPIGERKVLFDPYPFDQPCLRIQLSCKRLPERKYASAAEFRQVYFKAPNELVEYELLAA